MKVDAQNVPNDARFEPVIARFEPVLAREAKRRVYREAYTTGCTGRHKQA